MPPRLVAGLVAALLLLLAAPAADAAAPLPVGEADGVRIERPGGAIVITFSKRAAPLYEKIAGKRVEIECTRESHEQKLGFTESGSGGGWIRAPKTRRPLRTGDLTRGWDYCRVYLAASRRSSRELIVSIPLTQFGAVHLDEQLKTAVLMSLWGFAGEWGDRTTPSAYPTPARFLELLQQLSRRPGPVRGVVALASPADTPSAGDVGYYSDGQLHVAFVTLSSSGRRLSIEFGPGDDLRTNVLQYLSYDD